MTKRPHETSSIAKYRVMACVNASPAAFKALDYSLKLCQSLKSYSLTILYITALNPPQILPYIDHLEKAMNMEIKTQAVNEINECAQYIESHLKGKVDYEFVKIEGEGETGVLIQEYVNANHPKLDLLVVGTRGQGQLKRWALGSTSDFLVHHLGVPVVVIKNVE